MTSFNFDAAIKEAKAASRPLVEAILLGQSGAGKSRMLGTLPGKILYLHTSGENHGYKSAQVVAGDRMDPLCIDVSDGRKLSNDEAYARLIAILMDRDSLKGRGYVSIALDGASELEAIIRGSSAFKNLCTTSQGKHNTFAEPSATITLFRPIISGLKELQRAIGVHFAVTCILDCKEVGSSGEILEASPRLQGFSVAESVVQQFGDVIVVGALEKNGEVKHKIQFMTDVSKAAKDEAGRIKKAMNFRPRIAGVEGLPPILDPDFSEIAKLKATLKGDKK